MQTETNVRISPADLGQIVKSVFETMLGLDVRDSSAPWFPSSDRLAAAVHLAGSWNGVILAECDRHQACRFAARFLSIDPPDTVEDVVRDVLGELANMIGGNLKCVLTPGTQLSMPSVTDGNDFSVRFCGAQVQERIAFKSAEGVFWITILTRPPSPGLRHE